MSISLLIVLLVLLAAIVFVFKKEQFIDFIAKAVMGFARVSIGAKRKHLKVGEFSWCYLEAGKPENPTMLLLHGFGADKNCWLSYIGELSKEYHIIAPDLPGFGETQIPSADISFDVDQQIIRLHDFLAACQLGALHLAGNSMGGLILGMFAVKHPEMVKTLAFFDAVGLASTEESILLKNFSKGETTLLPTTVEEAMALMSMVVAKPTNIPKVFISFFLREIDKNRVQLEKIYALLVSYQRDQILAKQLHNIALPVLVLWGKEDQLLEVSGGENAHKVLLNSQLVVLDSIGHVPMVEAPKITASHHKSFIAASGSES